MTIRWSLLLCGVSVACIVPRREPVERIRVAADRARDTPVTVIQGGAAQALQGASTVSELGCDEERVLSAGAGGAVDGPTVRVRPRACWHAVDPTRWRSALENYVPSVREGNHTPLNTARSAFAGYLNAMHNRIHPLFAGAFLSTLDNLPASHPMNDGRLLTEVEILLGQGSGVVVRMGVIKSSGLAGFDAAVLEAITRAAPYGAIPQEIVSPDGNMYVHWEFHRNREACSTFNARPYLLKAQPKATED
ncbi:MAG: TonB C-terminal domain-containing protein [Polyangiaceae bacterium]